jgi:hypothetical protein
MASSRNGAAAARSSPRRTAPAASWRHAFAAARVGKDLRTRVAPGCSRRSRDRSGRSCSVRRRRPSGTTFVADFDALVSHHAHPARARFRRFAPASARVLGLRRVSAGRDALLGPPARCTPTRSPTKRLTPRTLPRRSAPNAASLPLPIATSRSYRDVVTRLTSARFLAPQRSVMRPPPAPQQFSSAGSPGSVRSPAPPGPSHQHRHWGSPTNGSTNALVERVRPAEGAEKRRRILVLTGQWRDTTPRIWPDSAGLQRT